MRVHDPQQKIVMLTGMVRLPEDSKVNTANIAALNSKLQQIAGAETRSVVNKGDGYGCY